MAKNNDVVQSVVLQIWQKFIVAKYSTQQTGEQVFIRNHAQVYLHQKR